MCFVLRLRVEASLDFLWMFYSWLSFVWRGREALASIQMLNLKNELVFVVDLSVGHLFSLPLGISFKFKPITFPCSFLLL